MNFPDNDQDNTGSRELSHSVSVFCCQCAKPLCLRKQVINLALGNSEIMYCLGCIAGMNNQEPKQVLVTTKEYIASRQCFAKEWHKYKSQSDCPEPNTCFIGECFGD